MSSAPEALVFRCGGCAASTASLPSDSPTARPAVAARQVSTRPVDLSGDALERLVAASPVPVLVDLWASWCGPCRAVAPVVRQVAAELARRLIVVKVNTDEHPHTLQRLGAP